MFGAIYRAPPFSSLVQVSVFRLILLPETNVFNVSSVFFAVSILTLDTGP